MTKQPAKASKDRPDPRRAALSVFRAVLRRRRPLDQAIEGNQAWGALSPRDRAFARLLVSQLLRRLGSLDAAIGHCLQRPLRERDGDLRDLLRLGAVQLLILQTPPHAAISTTMRMAERTPRLKGQKRLLNGVLARLSREGTGILADLDAARLDTPDWLWRRWESAYGTQTARAIATANGQEAPLDITAKGDREALAARFAKTEISATPLFARSLRLTGAKGNPAQLLGHREGDWWVQDAAAALVATLLPVEPGQAVLDLCAAPGGKTAALVAAGAAVTAVDQAAPRTARLRDNLDRLGLKARVVAADATVWRPETPAAAVLLDAPCSGSGTLRRHPDIAHLRREDDLASLTELQDRLLSAAAAMLAPGGRLLYAVCSLEPEEGPLRIAHLLEQNPDLAREAITAAEVAGETGLLTAEGALRSLPCQLAEHGGLDGFFACRLIRLGA